MATGGKPYRPEIPGAHDAQVADAWQILGDEVTIGASVVIADGRCDWVGIGLAETLARAGHWVRLCVCGDTPGQEIEPISRYHAIGVLHGLGVEVVPHVRLAGVDSRCVYFEHVASGEPVLCDNSDTLVLALGCTPADDLERRLAGFPGDLHVIGDCLAPRTAEEAVLEGLVAGTTL